jgi:tetratricopeptide (TPR) repeat protein
LAASGSFKEAEAILKAVLATNPEDGAAWHELGTAYYGAKDFENAATAFRRRSALEPDKAVANYSLALALIELKRVDEARTYLVRTLQLDPGHTKAKQRLAEIARPKEPRNEGLQKQAPPGPAGAPREPLLKKRTTDPGKLLIEAKPLARCNIFFYLLGGLLCIWGFAVFANIPRDRGPGLLIFLLGLAILVACELWRRSIAYRIYEGRIDVQRGVLSRTTYSVWSYEVTDVRFTQSLPQIVIRTATISLKVEGRKKPVRIAGIASRDKMKELFEKLRNIVLGERWEVKDRFIGGK